MIGVLRGINKTAIQVKYFSVNNFCQFNTQATAKARLKGSGGSTNRPPGSGQGATAHSGHLNPYITAARRDLGLGSYTFKMEIEVVKRTSPIPIYMSGALYCPAI